MPSAMSYGTYDDTVNALVGVLGSGSHILGERFSAADIVIGSAVRWMTLFKLLPEKPEFTSYVARLTSRPAFKSAAAKEEELIKALAS